MWLADVGREKGGGGVVVMIFKQQISQNTLAIFRNSSLTRLSCTVYFLAMSSWIPFWFFLFVFCFTSVWFLFVILLLFCCCCCFSFNFHCKLLEYRKGTRVWGRRKQGKQMLECLFLIIDCVRILLTPNKVFKAERKTLFLSDQCRLAIISHYKQNIPTMEKHSNVAQSTNSSVVGR